MCVLYVSFGSTVRARTLGALPCIVQVVLSGFSVRLFGFVLAKTLCRYCCMYFLAALVLVCVDVMVMSSTQAMTRTGALGGDKSAV